MLTQVNVTISINMKNAQGFPHKERHLSIVTLGYMQTIVFLLDVAFMKPGVMVYFHMEDIGR